MEDQPSCSSPRPMAFTVDFGDHSEDQATDKKKKLALRDSIGRFAPAKIKNKLPCPSLPSGSSSPAAAAAVVINSKDNSNCKANLVTDQDVIVLDEENNIAHKKQTVEAGGLHVDHVVGLVDQADQASDTGTYTIEDEEDKPGGIDVDVNEKSDRNKDIVQAFGVPEPEKICSREWVSMWAASNSFAEDNPIQEEDDLELEGGRSSSQRRRLPPTPLRLQQNGYQNSQDHHEPVEEDTNDYLRDTISLMTAMEARLSSCEEANAVVRSKEVAPTPKRRPKTASNDLQRSGSKNSPAAKAREAKEQAAQQWQRRKNYDPLKSMAKSKRSLRDHAQNYNTDESSDVESSASLTRASLSNPRVAMIRSDGGRHSLRQGKNEATPDRGSPQPQSLHSPLRRPPFKTNVLAQNGGRSTSSLSSKEAEFQAWKRRKNYNPMRSATASVVPTKSSPTASKTQQKQQQHHHHQLHQSSQKLPDSASKKESVKINNNSAPESAASNSQLHKRSASFHYPDGSSRVTHSVYSSEEDFNDEEEDDEEPRLYEVNDDELFLAYDSGGVVPPRRYKRSPPGGNGSTSSNGTQSGSKLEALDNLVISTIFSVSTKLCVLSGKLVKSVQERTDDKEEESMLQTLLYVLEDIDPPVSPSKKTSRELAGTLRNLKKVEQALQTLERSETDL